jgi:hypothetical protein
MTSKETRVEHTPTPWDAMRNALRFQDTREPKYLAPETESARPALTLVGHRDWPSYADMRAMLSERDDLVKALTDICSEFPQTHPLIAAGRAILSHIHSEGLPHHTRQWNFPNEHSSSSV